MFGGLIGTALGAIGGNFLEKGIGSIFGKSTADQNYEYERRLQQHDQEFQKEMRATAYQTAVQDMQNAGINPAVALSQGGGDTYGGSSSHGSVAMQTPTGGTMAENISSIINTALTKAQKENIEADTDLKNKQSGKTKAEQKLIETQEEIQGIIGRAQEKLIKAQNKTEIINALKIAEETITAGIENYWLSTYGHKPGENTINAITAMVQKLIQKGASPEDATEQIINQIRKAIVK